MNKKKVTNFERKNMKHFVCATFCLAVLVFAGCQKISKSLGGNVTVNLPQGRKLVNASWDEGSDFWSLTRPAKDGEKPETYIMYESSNIGILHGTVTVIEH